MIGPRRPKWRLCRRRRKPTPPPPSPLVPLRLLPISPQTVEAGRPLTVAVSVEDPQRWKGKLRFSLESGAPAGATIDPQSGMFTWTPTQDESTGKHEVTAHVEALGSRPGHAAFTITVTRPPAVPEEPTTSSAVEELRAVCDYGRSPVLRQLGRLGSRILSKPFRQPQQRIARRQADRIEVFNSSPFARDHPLWRGHESECRGGG